MGAGNDHTIIGYRIVRIDSGSPMSKLNLEPMLNFILYSDQNPPFGEFIASNENKKITLTIFNIITRDTREVTLIPKKWTGEGLLGATLRQEEYLLAHTRVLRVLNIYNNSPLSKAGLKPKTDYILGNDKVLPRCGRWAKVGLWGLLVEPARKLP